MCFYKQATPNGVTENGTAASGETLYPYDLFVVSACKQPF